MSGGGACRSWARPRRCSTTAWPSARQHADAANAIHSIARTRHQAAVRVPTGSCSPYLLFSWPHPVLCTLQCLNALPHQVGLLPAAARWNNQAVRSTESGCEPIECHSPTNQGALGIRQPPGARASRAEVLDIERRERSGRVDNQVRQRRKPRDRQRHGWLAG